MSLRFNTKEELDNFVKYLFDNIDKFSNTAVTDFSKSAYEGLTGYSFAIMSNIFGGNSPDFAVVCTYNEENNSYAGSGITITGVVVRKEARDVLEHGPDGNRLGQILVTDYGKELKVIIWDDYFYNVLDDLKNVIES